MAEGDTVMRMAIRIERAFEGREVCSAEAPNPRNPIRPGVERLVGRDLPLSYKLMRYINSAFFSLSGKVTSVSSISSGIELRPTPMAWIGTP